MPPPPKPPRNPLPRFPGLPKIPPPPPMPADLRSPPPPLSASDFPDSLIGGPERVLERLDVTSSVPVHAKPSPPPLPDPFPSQEPTTGHATQTFTLAQTVLGRFDLMTDGERTDLAELVVAFDDAGPEDRAVLLAVARGFAYR